MKLNKSERILAGALEGVEEKTITIFVDRSGKRVFNAVNTLSQKFSDVYIPEYVSNWCVRLTKNLGYDLKHSSRFAKTFSEEIEKCGFVETERL